MMINEFMEELKQLCEKHGVRIINAYDELVYLEDVEGNKISEHVDFDNFQADPYVDRSVDHANINPISREWVAAAFQETYIKNVAEYLNKESSFSKLFK